MAEAEGATGGLFEVSFLPAIDWDPGYLARLPADPHGKVEPTPAELAGSQQANCILYSQLVNERRQSSPANRTSFLYTLDRLGYRGHYDVYAHMGFGNTGNHLAGRATVEQMTGYALAPRDAITGSRATLATMGTAARARDWSAIGYDYLTAEQDRYGREYYLDYPLLFVHPMAPGQSKPLWELTPVDDLYERLGSRSCRAVPGNWTRSSAL